MDKYKTVLDQLRDDELHELLGVIIEAIRERNCESHGIDK